MIKMTNQLIQETHYGQHPNVSSIQLWAKYNESSNNMEKKYTHYYKVLFRDGSSKIIDNSNFDPVTQNDRIVISYDDSYLFSPHYKKGIAQINIETGEQEFLYPVKHMFSIWATSTSLLCIHNEYHPQLERYLIGESNSVERMRVNGMTIVPIQQNCIMCKIKETQYAFIDPDHLDKRSIVSLEDLCGFEDASFEIESAKYINGKIYAKYYRSDPNSSGLLLTIEEFLDSTPSAINAFNNVCKK